MFGGFICFIFYLGLGWRVFLSFFFLVWWLGISGCCILMIFRFLPFASLWCYVKLRFRHRLILVLCAFFLSLSNRSSILKKMYYFNTDTIERHIFYHMCQSQPLISPPLVQFPFPLGLLLKRGSLALERNAPRICFVLVCFFPGQQVVGLLFLLLLTLREFLVARNVCIWICVRLCSTKFCEPNTCLCFAFPFWVNSLISFPSPRPPGLVSRSL